MSDVGPYGVTEHADAQMVTANQLVGERAGLATGNAVAPGVGPALHSTAPYKKPKPKIRGVKGCCAKEGTCAAPAVRGTEYCFFHSSEPVPSDGPRPRRGH